MNVETKQAKAERLRELHRRGSILVMPNAWDPLSARAFESCGFPAVATTSAGIAYSFGYPDGERLSRKEMAEATKRIVGAVSVPVTADVEAGYGPSAEDAAETARAVVEAGAVGLNLEDATDASPPGQDGSPGEEAVGPLVELAAQVEKIRAVVAAGEETGVPLVVNARTDVYWRSVGDDPGRRFRETIRRANAFLEAGADCVFVPGVKDPETILELTREISGPLNVLAGPGVSTIPELANLGVRRVSVGSGPARAVMGLVRRIGWELLDDGTYASLSEGAVPYDEANRLFSEERS